VNILVVGYNAFDVTVPVGGMPDVDSKCEVADILYGGGGPGATAAVCLARLGARVKLVTVFGDDEGAAVQHRDPAVMALHKLALSTRRKLRAPGSRCRG